PQSIWKKKKKLFVSKESTAAILSRLGIWISVDHYFYLATGHPNLGQTALFRLKLNAYAILKKITAKNGELGRFSSVRKPPSISDFPFRKRCFPPYLRSCPYCLPSYRRIDSGKRAKYIEYLIFFSGAFYRAKKWILQQLI
ncbi:hypothetical protein COCON_G00023870, partial [Conger conger]